MQTLEKLTGMSYNLDRAYYIFRLLDIRLLVIIPVLILILAHFDSILWAIRWCFSLLTTSYLLQYINNLSLGIGSCF